MFAMQGYVKAKRTVGKVDVFFMRDKIRRVSGGESLGNGVRRFLKKGGGYHPSPFSQLSRLLLAMLK